MGRASLARSGSNVLRSRWGRTMAVVSEGWERERDLARGLLTDTDTPIVLSRMNRIAADGCFDVDAAGRCWVAHVMVGGVEQSATLRYVGAEIVVVFQGWSKPGTLDFAGHATTRRAFMFLETREDGTVGLLHEGGLRVTRLGGKWLMAAKAVINAASYLRSGGQIKTAWHCADPADWVPFDGVWRACAPLRDQEIEKRRSGRRLRRLAAKNGGAPCKS